jgi:hypothetical protein
LHLLKSIKSLVSVGVLPNCDHRVNDEDSEDNEGFNVSNYPLFMAVTAYMTRVKEFSVYNIKFKCGRSTTGEPRMTSLTITAVLSESQLTNDRQKIPEVR